jgi:hypothetical protein
MIRLQHSSRSPVWARTDRAGGRRRGADPRILRRTACGGGAVAAARGAAPRALRCRRAGRACNGASRSEAQARHRKPAGLRSGSVPLRPRLHDDALDRLDAGVPERGQARCARRTRRAIARRGASEPRGPKHAASQRGGHGVARGVLLGTRARGARATRGPVQPADRVGGGRHCARAPAGLRRATRCARCWSRRTIA